LAGVGGGNTLKTLKFEKGDFLIQDSFVSLTMFGYILDTGGDLILACGRP